MASAGWSLPGYAIEELVGFGGTGEVWRARDEATGRVVALKRLRPTGGVPERDRLRREAAVLAGVVSPHLVRLRTAVTTADSLVLVLDYAAGGSLASLIAARRMLLPGEVVTVADAIATGLRDAHAVGLVHSDVTPSNVLFNHDGRPLLSDLGLARFAGTSPPGGGTPGFTDPVVLAGGEPSQGSDVYGLAATCYAALTGAPPVLGETADEVLAVWTSGRLPIRAPARPSVPIPLLDTIVESLTAAPDERPDVATFAAALRRACRPARVRLAGASRVVANAPTETEAPLLLDGDPPSTGHGDMSTHRVTTDSLASPDGVGPADRARPTRSPAQRSGHTNAAPRAVGSRRGRDLTGLATRVVEASRLMVFQRGGSTRAHTGERAWPARSVPRAVVVAAVALAAGVVVVACVAAGVWWAGTARQRPPTIATVTAADQGSRSTAARTTVTREQPSSSRRSSSRAPLARATCVHGRGGVIESRGDRRSRAATLASTAPGTSSTDRGMSDEGVAKAVVGALDALRDSAFVDEDPSRLSCVYVPSSAAYRSDLHKLRALMAAGERAVGLRLRVRGVDVLARRGPLVEVAVHDELADYRIVDLTGRAIVTRAGRGPATWRVLLRRDAVGWRIAAVGPGGPA